MANDWYRMGGVEMRLVPDQPVFMDGGAMFGIVPKMLWTRHKTPDARNRVTLATNCLLVRTAQGISLVEGGIGDKLSPKQRDHFGLGESSRLGAAIGAAGVEPEEVDHVFLSHLHFDHCGALTYYDGDRLRPTFPRARHFVQRVEYEAMMNPDPRSRATYIQENVNAVREAGLLELLDGDCEPVDGFEMRVTPGHTAGHQVVLVKSDDQAAAFTGDLVPYPSHLRTSWIAATDVMPLDTMTTKQAFLQEARDKDWILVMYHEHETPVGRLDGENWVPF